MHNNTGPADAAHQSADDTRSQLPATSTEINVITVSGNDRRTGDNSHCADDVCERELHNMQTCFRGFVNGTLSNSARVCA